MGKFILKLIDGIKRKRYYRNLDLRGRWEIINLIEPIGQARTWEEESAAYQILFPHLQFKFENSLGYNIKFKGEEDMAWRDCSNLLWNNLRNLGDYRPRSFKELTDWRDKQILLFPNIYQKFIVSWCESESSSPTYEDNTFFGVKKKAYYALTLEEAIRDIKLLANSAFTGNAHPAFAYDIRIRKAKKGEIEINLKESPFKKQKTLCKKQEPTLWDNSS